MDKLLYSYLVVDEQLNRIVDTLEKDQLIGLFWDRVGERGANPPFGRFQPHAGCEGVHLRDDLSHHPIHVAGPHRERELIALRVAVVCQT